MAAKLEISGIRDFINLTFCCQQVTVIADFFALNTIGYDHYMNLHGCYVTMEELKVLDEYKTALRLIDSGAGTATPSWDL